MAGQHGLATMIAAAALLIGALASIPTGLDSIGVCYGTQGDGLPSAADVVQLYQSKRIGAMRIYSPDATILQALRGSGIDVIVDETNLDALISNAAAWVQTNIQPYKDDVNFRYIAVGNEVEGSDTQKILPAMQSLAGALSAAGFGDIKVSTGVKMSVLATSSTPPPLTSEFVGMAGYAPASFHDLVDEEVESDGSSIGDVMAPGHPLS